MADPHLLAEALTRPDSQTPLLNNNHTTGGTEDEVRLRKLEENNPPEDDCDTDLDKTLNRLETFLTLLGFRQSSPSSFGLSWVVFLLIGVALPVAVLVFPKCHGCERYQIDEFEIDIVVSQACLAAVSLLCLSHNLRKYGIRKFLFVDRHSGQMARFRDEYIKKIRACARLLVLWTLPCFTLKTGREIARIVYMPHQSWWLSGVLLFALIISWIYVTAIYLSACIVFHLVCNLQIIHFDDYGKRFGSDSDVTVLIEEHVRLRYNLSKISHRFRIYLILVFTVVTASLFIALFQTTGYNGLITLINSGDLAISSIVQVAGITLCLNAAAKISHRAQGIASLASRWHAIATCSSRDAPQMRDSNSGGNLRTLSSLGAIPVSNSESDLDSLDYNIAIPRHLPSYMSSYHKRQAFVLYLQMNPGGITIFGWTVDRGLINTIFFIQLSLVLFVLGKTVINASESD